MYTKFDLSRKDVAEVIENNVEVEGMMTAKMDLMQQAEQQINQYTATELIPYIPGKFILEAEDELIEDRIQKGYPMDQAVADVILDWIAAQIGLPTGEISYRIN